MKTGKVKIGNKEYITCFSVRVMMNIREKYGDIEDGMQKVAGGFENLEDDFWIVYEMMKAGAKYAEMEGLENPPVPEYETLYDLVDMHDMRTLVKSIVSTIKTGSETEIETEPSEETKKNAKNAETTQDQ